VKPKYIKISISTSKVKPQQHTQSYLTIPTLLHSQLHIKNNHKLSSNKTPQQLRCRYVGCSGQSVSQSTLNNNIINLSPNRSC